MVLLVFKPCRLTDGGAGGADRGGQGGQEGGAGEARLMCARAAKLVGCPERPLLAELLASAARLTHTHQTCIVT